MAAYRRQATSRAGERRFLADLRQFVGHWPVEVSNPEPATPGWRAPRPEATSGCSSSAGWLESAGAGEHWE